MCAPVLEFWAPAFGACVCFFFSPGGGVVASGGRIFFLGGGDVSFFVVVFPTRVLIFRFLPARGAGVERAWAGRPRGVHQAFGVETPSIRTASCVAGSTPPRFRFLRNF